MLTGRECFAAPHEESACGANFAFSFLGSEFNFNFGRPIRGIRAVEGAIGDLRPLIVLPVSQCLGHAYIRTSHLQSVGKLLPVGSMYSMKAGRPTEQELDGEERARAALSRSCSLFLPLLFSNVRQGRVPAH